MRVIIPIQFFFNISESEEKTAKRKKKNQLKDILPEDEATFVSNNPNENQTIRNRKYKKLNADNPTVNQNLYESLIIQCSIKSSQFRSKSTSSLETKVTMKTRLPGLMARNPKVTNYEVCCISACKTAGFDIDESSADCIATTNFHVKSNYRSKALPDGRIHG